MYKKEAADGLPLSSCIIITEITAVNHVYRLSWKAQVKNKGLINVLVRSNKILHPARAYLRSYRGQ